MKYLGIHLTKEVKDMYPENCKILKKLSKIQINLQYIIGLEELILLKHLIVPKMICRFNAIPQKPNDIFPQRQIKINTKYIEDLKPKNLNRRKAP